MRVEIGPSSDRSAQVRALRDGISGKRNFRNRVDARGLGQSGGPDYREPRCCRTAERKRRADLVAEAGAWRQASLIRVYVAAVRTQAKARGEEAVAKVEEWVEWALHVADTGDPLVGDAGS